VGEAWFHRVFLWPFSQVHSPFQWPLIKSILKSSFFIAVLLQILHGGTARTLSNNITLQLQTAYFSLIRLTIPPAAFCVRRPEVT
jgi:hypothetical protein